MKNTQDIKQRKLIKDGDIFILGNHRVACGSAIDSDLISRLVEKSKIREILTDPPYGVAYVENKAHFKETIKSNLSNNTVIQGDQLQSDEEYSGFSEKWLKAITSYLDKYNTVYIFNSDVMLCALRRGMKAAGIYYSQLIIWVKNTIVVGRKDYLPGHEIIAYGWFGRHKMERSKGKSVVFYPKPAKSKLHPTMKPVGLLRKLILNSTKIGEIVYDPFGGSGSTLMACEHTSRKCLMIEIDPVHTATIIQRWETLTGKEAIKL